MTDLFLSKRQQLLDWMKAKHTFSTHEVIAWGCQNYSNRSDRTKRDFLKQGLIRKLSDSEKGFRGFKCKDAVYDTL